MKYTVLLTFCCGLLAGIQCPARQPADQPPASTVERPSDRPGDPARRDDRRPAGDRAPRRPGEPGFLDAAAHDPKLLGVAIDRMLADVTKAMTRLQEAKKQLEGGTPPEEVFRSLREARAGALADRFVVNWRDHQRDDSAGRVPLFERPQGGPPTGSPEQLDELLRFVREVRPQLADKLEKWQKDDQKAFRLVIGRLMPKANDAFRERNRDEKLYELRKEDLRQSIFVVEKSAELRRMQRELKGEAPTPQFETEKSELREMMGKAYDARVRVREYETAQLAKRLADAQSKIQETKDAREKLLDRAVDEVLSMKRETPQPGDQPGDRPGPPGGHPPEPPAPGKGPK